MKGTGEEPTRGRLTGPYGKASINFAPLGIDPASTRIIGTPLGFVPVLVFSAQLQRDTTASGNREKEIRRQYVGALAVEFENLESSGFKPGLELSRSVGSDLLTGKPDDSVTKIAFTVAF